MYTVCFYVLKSGGALLKKTKKILMILLIVAIVSVIAATVVINVFIGRDNFYAAIKGITVSGEQLEADINNNKKEQLNTIKELGFDISTEDMEKIVSGELDDEEKIVEKLLGSVETSDETAQTVGDEEKTSNSEKSERVPSEKVPSSKKDDKTQTSKKDNSANANNKSEANKNETKQNTAMSGDKKNTESTAVPNNDERIAELIAKMYVYKSQYTGKISSVVSSMLSEYGSLPSEQRGYSAKVSVYNNYAGQIATMEAQCDAQVNAIVSEMRTLLKESGKDQSLADSLLSAYSAEKENTKAYYVNKYAH